jgi:mRNA-degrading endonuclease toxin of MazEF toxin-antitoxin module
VHQTPIHFALSLSTSRFRATTTAILRKTLRAGPAVYHSDYAPGTVLFIPDGEGLSTQVAIGPDEGLKHPSWIMCDNLVSIRKADLTNYVGSVPRSKLAEVDRALGIALDRS